MYKFYVLIVVLSLLASWMYTNQKIQLITQQKRALFMECVQLKIKLDGLERDGYGVTLPYAELNEVCDPITF